MPYNGCTVIDMDAHIRERADKFFKDYIDPEYRAPFNLLCEAIARQEAKGDRYALFGSTSAVIEKIEAGRALGVGDNFGLTARSEMERASAEKTSCVQLNASICATRAVPSCVPCRRGRDAELSLRRIHRSARAMSESLA